jgi:S1-C subfamily serine protease
VRQQGRGPHGKQVAVRKPGKKSVLPELNTDLSDIIERVHRSLVSVHNGKRGAGAGTIWHPKGLIVTNAHVAGRGLLRVGLPDGRTLLAQVLARDADRDLAALRVEAGDLPAVQLGDSLRLRPGEWVLAVGHPWGVSGAVTAGVVIGAGVALPEMTHKERDWVVVSLHMRPGHSGGPLVDARGRLVGINTMINGPDVGVAIPVHVVVEFLRQALLR